MQDAAEDVQQKEQAPPLKKVRAEEEEEEAAAEEVVQRPRNRRERRAGMIAEHAEMRELLQHLPEGAIQQARQAREAQAREAQANAAAERQRAALFLEEQARQAQGADANPGAHREQAAYGLEQQQLDEQSGLGRLEQVTTSISVRGAATLQETNDRLAEAAQVTLPEDDDELMGYDEES